jgi:hypothetical protein
MPARITVCYPDQPASELFLFEDNGYRLGRSPDCELHLNHPTVSRYHANVLHANRLWELKDEHSRNGTLVNGARVTTSTLQEDALISIGQLDCLFETKTSEQLDAIVAHNDWRKQQAGNDLPASSVTDSQLVENLNLQLQNILMLTNTQRGLILLGDELEKLQIVVSQGLQSKDFSSTDFVGSVGAITHCLQSAKPIVAMDVSRNFLLSTRQSVELKQIAALACIPLIFEDKVVGIVYADSKMSDKVLTELDLEILQSMSHQIEATVQTLLLQQSIDSLQLMLNENMKDHSLLSLCH